MGIALGVHVGHDASCAVVRDGELVAAVQLERLSRKRHHAIVSLWNELPVNAVLESAGLTIDDVDVIVSCFQGGSPGGFGLHRGLIEPSFSLFDPFSPKHFTLSHHLAHAYCAAAYAPRAPVAIVVSDYAGSSTIDGQDFDLPFRDWYRSLTAEGGPVSLRTESLSIYRAELERDDWHLALRELRTPHNEPESAICSVASLYENVTQAVFRKPNSHGSLMALAAFGERTAHQLELGPMVDIADDDSVNYRNDWQHAFYPSLLQAMELGASRLTQSSAAAVAHLCQDSTEKALLAYARRAAKLTGSRHLALAGGTFLNILANTRIARAGLFESVSLPSAPHDAGIAIGCAFRGALRLGDRPERVMHDRLGPRYSAEVIDRALRERAGLVTERPVAPREVARLIHDGAIVARCAGRSEFGPRALGGRSLLASPLLASTKDRLNRIKGRQPWRPVAPVVSAEHVEEAFIGPTNSFWMTFSHEIKPEHRAQLGALAHPDNSTRAQTLLRAQDPWLDDLLAEVGSFNGYPILANTSLNGPGEPIVESPFDAIQWFLEHDDVDFLLLEDRLVERRPAAEVLSGRRLAPNPSAFVMASPEGAITVKVHDVATRLSSRGLKALFAFGRPQAALTLADLAAEDPEIDVAEVWALFVRNVLVDAGDR